MSSPLNDHATGWRAGFGTRASADNRFTAEDIVRIVAAGESGMKLTDLCASEDISLEQYYVWKVKFSGLTADQVTELRVWEQKKLQKRSAAIKAMIAGAIATPCVVIGACAITALPKSQAKLNDDSVRQAVAAIPSSRVSQAALTVPAAPAFVPVPQAAAAPKPAAPVPTAPAEKPAPAAPATTVEKPAPPVTGTPAADDVVTNEPSGYRVQVAAVPNVEEAHSWIDRLHKAGYPAYMIRTQIDRTTMYRVRVGPLKSRGEAGEIAEQLKKDGFPSPWIVN